MSTYRVGFAIVGRVDISISAESETEAWLKAIRLVDSKGDLGELTEFYLGEVQDVTVEEKP